eukprot:30838-Pelagococcus_subviridis.AAC.14
MVALNAWSDVALATPMSFRSPYARDLGYLTPGRPTGGVPSVVAAEEALELELELEVEVEVASASASAVGGTSSRYSDDTQNEFSSAAFTLDIGRLGQPTSSHSLSRS